MKQLLIPNPRINPRPSTRCLPVKYRLRSSLLVLFNLGFGIIILFFFLTACSSFKPIYNNREFETFLSNIEIEEIETLENNEIYHQIAKLFGASDDTKYILKISLSNSVSPLLITEQANVVKQNITQMCNYRLVDKSSGAVLTEGKIRLVGSYNSNIAPYASYTNEKYTKRSITQTTAEELRMRLMMYFESKP